MTRQEQQLTLGELREFLLTLDSEHLLSPGFCEASFTIIENKEGDSNVQLVFEQVYETSVLSMLYYTSLSSLRRNIPDFISITNDTKINFRVLGEKQINPITQLTKAYWTLLINSRTRENNTCE